MSIEQRLSAKYATALPGDQGATRHAIIVSLGMDRVAVVLTLPLTPNHAAIVTGAGKLTEFHEDQAEFCTAALAVIRRDLPHLFPRAEPPPRTGKTPAYPACVRRAGDASARQRRRARRNADRDRND
jgi:hypothetical protein